MNDNVDAEAGGPSASFELPLRPRVTEDGDESSDEGSVENAGEAGDEVVKQDNIVPDIASGAKDDNGNDKDDSGKGVDRNEDESFDETVGTPASDKTSEDAGDNGRHLF